MTAWQIAVRGIPAAQGSKRHVGNGVMVESSKKVKPWREAVRSEAQDALEAGAQPIEGPVSVRITFMLPRPRAHYRTGKHADVLRPDAPRYCSVRPDLDKLVRSTLDALTAAGAYPDDARVGMLVVAKMYATTFAGAIITIGPVPL